jgi:two-component system NtrC family sensor kinase
MITPLSKLRVSFQAKVLAPVVAVLVALTATTIWIVNHRISAQLHSQAEQQLDTAGNVFQQARNIRQNQLLSRYRDVSNEPRLRALVTATDSRTTSEALKGMFDEDPDAGLFVVLSADGRPFASASRDPSLDINRFEADSAAALRQALAGGEAAQTIESGARLYDLVAVPIREGAEVVGVMGVGVETGAAAAQEIKQLTHSEVLFVVNHTLAATSLKAPGEYPRLIHRFEQLSSTPGAPFEEVLDHEHFLGKAWTFGAPGSGSGFLLLSSYETSRQVLHYTQAMLLGVGVGGILASSCIVWLLVRKITQPLRQLRDNAEAVGRGDFSRRVEVASQDECGDLASAFNQMTDNLRASHADLEKTVETLKTTQHQLIESEKLAGIGEFVAGVAHELNNPLTSVMGFAELLQQAEMAEPQRRLLDMIAKSAKRCTRIVQSLLSFARRHAPERKIVSVNEIVESAIEILQYQMRTSNIEVITQLDARLPATNIDPHQMQQVFLNIINNARQAMEGEKHKGGSLRVTTLTAGERVRIIFEDTGPGIPEENVKKVFNPFFTTKEVGKGTGLGLSLCYGIVTEHGGTINVQSKPGMGATFTIELPISREAAAARADVAPAAAPARNAQEGVGKSVLVIDDEDAILQMIQQALSVSGYKVDVVRDGETALRRLGQYHYDLALCDWKMPGLTGQDVYERLRTADPEMCRRMIFITGDTLNARTQEFLKSSDKICLSKPFTLSEFRAAIGRLLSPAQPAGAN